MPVANMNLLLDILEGYNNVAENKSCTCKDNCAKKSSEISDD